MEKVNESQTIQCNNLWGMNATELVSLIGKPIYAIRNNHRGSNHRNFYIATWEIQNIIVSCEGIWIDTGWEIFHESELGNRFNLDKKEIQEKLKYVKGQSLNNISEIFKVREKHVIDRNPSSLRRDFFNEKIL